MKDEYKALYEAVSNKFSIGTFEEFEARMQSPEDRKRFYDAVSKKGFSLGGYDDYEERLKKKEASTESQSTGAQESTPSVSASNVPVPETILEGMERFKKTGQATEPAAVGTKAAEKPKKKAEGSSVVIDAIFTEEAAKGREAQDILLEHDKYVNTNRDKNGNFQTRSVENIGYSEQAAIDKIEKVFGADFKGKSYERELRRLSFGV